jgi:hypothetical protein
MRPPVLVVPVALAASLCSCGGTPAAQKASPVIDALVMPASASAGPDGSYVLAGTISFHDDDEIVTRLHFQVDGLDLATPAFDVASGTGVPVTVKLTATRGVTVPYEVSIVGASGAESAIKTATVTLE